MYPLIRFSQRLLRASQLSPSGARNGVPHRRQTKQYSKGGSAFHTSLYHLRPRSTDCQEDVPEHMGHPHLYTLCGSGSCCHSVSLSACSKVYRGSCPVGRSPHLVKNFCQRLCFPLCGDGLTQVLAPASSGSRPEQFCFW